MESTSKENLVSPLSGVLWLIMVSTPKENLVSPLSGVQGFNGVNF